MSPRVVLVGPTIPLPAPAVLTTALPDASGVAAPHMPVLPPCGTIGVRVSAAVNQWWVWCHGVVGICGCGSGGCGVCGGVAPSVR